MNITFIKKYESVNKYFTKNWDTEHSYKYLFKFKDNYIEAGYFVHYKDGNQIKKVIELSSSYGCPFKCKYCASSNINDFEILKSNTILEVFEYIMGDNIIEKNENIIVPITGIGDLYFSVKEVVKFINKCSEKYKNILFDISTVALNKIMLKELQKIKDIAKIRYFQLTFISCDNKIKELVNIKDNYDFNNIVYLANTSDFKFFRINYIMIKDYNDDIKTFERFIEIMRLLKDKASVRISRINDTSSSIQNNLLCGSIDNMEILNKMLKSEGIKSYLFYSKKNDNMNCGQLIYDIEKEI